MSLMLHPFPSERPSVAVAGVGFKLTETRIGAGAIFPPNMATAAEFLYTCCVVGADLLLGLGKRSDGL